MAPEPSPNTSPSSSTLTALYTCPTTSKTFAYSLSCPVTTTATTSTSATETSAPANSTNCTQQKLLYLSALRKSVIQMQEDVNTFLTEKMAEDKASLDGEKGVGEEVEDESEYDGGDEEGYEGAQMKEEGSGNMR